MSTQPIEFAQMVCDACQGQSPALMTCTTCHGHGVWLASRDEVLFWGVPLDGFSFTFRRLRIRLRALVHMMLVVLVLVGVVGAAWLFLSAGGDVASLTYLATFMNGSWAAVLFWGSLVLLAFFIFRLAVYGQSFSVLPEWSVSTRDRLTSKFRGWVAFGSRIQERDISIYFQPSAWQVLEHALDLAAKLQQAQVRPVHVFAAALSSPAGGIFMRRLGMDFAKIKPGLIELLRRGETNTEISFSVDTRKLLLAAYQQAVDARRKSVGTIELFLTAFLSDEALRDVIDAAGYPQKYVTHVAEWIRTQELLREQRDRFVHLARLKPNSSMNRSMTARQTELLDRFSEDLTLLARNGYIAPVIGRDTELDEIFRLMDGGRQSVVLIGEPGTGKASLVEAIARRMVEEDVPPMFNDKRLVSVHVAQLITSGDPASAGERLLQMMVEAGISGNIILVLHGIEALVGAGARGNLDLAETLAQELDKGYVRVIASTTPSAWTNHLERRSLGAKLGIVQVRPLSDDQTIRVLMAKSGFIEYQQKVFFSYAALEQIAKLSSRYIRETALPESAIRVATEAAAYARSVHGEHGFVSADDVAHIIHQKTNIPVESVGKDESTKLLSLESNLHTRVIGQDQAVVAVAQAMRRARADIRESKRPIANFLFLGPTGVGKTELAKALGAEYFGSEQSMVRLDMSEYQDRSSIARIIGEPGDSRGGLLTEAVRRTPFTIVLLDELEKANPDILTLFLQVMDDGRLTDGVGRTVDFTNVVLIATSNAGTQFIQDEVANATPIEQIKTALLERELRSTFRPEFLNRFDAVIVFKPLTLDDVTQIAWLMIHSITKRLEEKGILFRAEDEAVEALASAGFDPLFGARPLRRVIQERVENALADLLLQQGVKRKDTLILQADMTLRVEPFQHS